MYPPQPDDNQFYSNAQWQLLAQNFHLYSFALTFNSKFFPTCSSNEYFNCVKYSDLIDESQCLSILESIVSGFIVEDIPVYLSRALLASGAFYQNDFVYSLFQWHSNINYAYHSFILFLFNLFRAPC